MGKIMCPHCGNTISDKEKYCPLCGHNMTDLNTADKNLDEKTRIINNNFDYNKKSVSYLRDPSHHYDENHRNTNSNFDFPSQLDYSNNSRFPQNNSGSKRENNMILLLIILLAAVIVFGGIGVYFYIDNQKKKRLELLEAQCKVDSLTAASEAERMARMQLESQRNSEKEAAKSREEIKKNIYDQMEWMIDKRRKDIYKKAESNGDYVDDYGNFYFTTDINKDGIPELWIVTGTTNSNSNVGLYYADYDSKILKNIVPYKDNTGAWNLSFYRGNGYLIEKYIDYSKDQYLINKVNIANGKMVFNNLSNVSSPSYLPSISEPEIIKTNLNDYSTLKSAFDF